MPLGRFYRHNILKGLTNKEGIMGQISSYAKLALIIIAAAVVSVSIGGNGCLWVGQSDNAAAAGGSSGAYIATSPSPASGAANVAVGTTKLSWATVTGALSYKLN